MSNTFLKDTSREKHIVSARLLFSLLAVVAVFIAIGARYTYLQVFQHERYQTQSERNRVHVQSIPPKRGLIYDRNGVLLAENQPSYSLTIVRELVGDMEQTLALLQSELAITPSEIEKFRERLKRARHFEEIPLRFRLSEAEIARIAVNRYRLPGVEVSAQLVRNYPFKGLFAHSIGYVGRINDRELDSLDRANYAGTHHIGKTGIEKYYEDLLHGEVGYQNVETNAQGKVLRVLDRSDPVPGKTLTLTLDVAMQRAAQQALEGERGSVVAIELATGGVLAIVSTPVFDPNLFVNGISVADYKALHDDPDLPLFNRSIIGRYPPGSTIKPLMALAGLEENVVTEYTRVRDPGWYQLPNDERKYRDWKKWGHGKTVDMKQAIVESCDVYFYQLAYDLGIDNIHRYGSEFGLGKPTGIDIPSERGGLLPSREWKRRSKRMPWFPGETLNIGIGQGYMLTTPLQLALMTEVLANRGVAYVPHLLKEVDGSEAPLTMLPTVTLKDERHWDLVNDAMEAVVHSPRGTAKIIADKARFKMAGKTGTAQVVGIAQDAEYDAESLHKRQRDHALFVGFAPYEHPQIAVAVIVENGEHGSSTAAPIARRMFDEWLNREPSTAQAGIQPRQGAEQ